LQAVDVFDDRQLDRSLLVRGLSIAAILHIKGTFLLQLG
jgi:hypothetical protein